MCVFTYFTMVGFVTYHPEIVKTFWYSKKTNLEELVQFSYANKKNNTLVIRRTKENVIEWNKDWKVNIIQQVNIREYFFKSKGQK